MPFQVLGLLGLKENLPDNQACAARAMPNKLHERRKIYGTAHHEKESIQKGMADESQIRD